MTRQAITFEVSQAEGDDVDCACLICGQPRTDALSGEHLGRSVEFKVRVRTMTNTTWRGLHAACWELNGANEVSLCAVLTRLSPLEAEAREALLKATCECTGYAEIKRYQTLLLDIRSGYGTRFPESRLPELFLLQVLGFVRHEENILKDPSLSPLGLAAVGFLSRFGVDVDKWPLLYDVGDE